jgi:hypothetical protein
MRIYAVREDTKEKVLVEIKCDYCDATIKPHPSIRDSGWIAGGYYVSATGERGEWDSCPICASSK